MFVENHQLYAESLTALSPVRRTQQRIWVSGMVIPKVTSMLNGNEQVNILSIGAGNGELDMMFLEELKNFLTAEGEAHKKIVYHVLEPNIGSLQMFQNNAGAVTLQKLGLSNVQFSWVNKSFEDYIHNNGHNQMQFDVIVLGHCLYYMNAEATLQQSLINLLKTRGCVVAVVGAEGDIWTQLIARYQEKIPSLSSELNHVTEKSISEVAASNGWRYEAFVGKQDLEITEIFDDTSKAGNKLLEFFLHREDPRKNFDEDLLQDIVKFLRNSDGNSVKNQNGERRWYVNQNDGVVLIFKD